MLSTLIAGRGVVLRLAASAAGASLLVAAASCGHRPEPRAEGSPAAAVDVEVGRATFVDLADRFEVGGEIRARETATVVSRVTGAIREIRVKAGDRVRAGQPLIVLDARELRAGETRATASAVAAAEGVKLAEAERKAAEAALALARATHRRIAELRERNSATAHELDEAVAALSGAEARLAAAEARGAEVTAQVDAARAAADLARVVATYAVLSAPFDGLVTQKHVEAGNTATPGLPLLTVEDTRAFRLDVRVDESRTPSLAPGQPVGVRLDAAGAGELTGRILEISRALDAGSHAFLVKVDLAGTDSLRSGLYGRAVFRGPSRRALVAPLAGLVRQGQLTSVFVAGSDGRARLRLVRAAEPTGNQVEILSGLADGEAVVLDPPRAVEDGTPIRVRQGR